MEKTKKAGRPPMTKEQKRFSVGAAIRPDQIAAWKSFGGSKWLQAKIDEQIRINQTKENP